MIRFSALGDVAMLVPVVREVVMSMPEVEVTVLSKPFCAPMFEGLGERVRFIGADIKGEYTGMKGLGRLFHELDMSGFDYVADMHGVLRTHYLGMRFRLAGYSVAKIDKCRAERRRLTASEGKKRMKRLSTSFEKYRAVLHRLPLDGLERLDAYVANEKRGCVLNFGTTDVEVEKVLGMIEKNAACHDINGTTAGLSRRIGIAPFAAHGGKIYPKEKMERVIDMLIKKDGKVNVFLFGGGGQERDIMLGWQARWPDNVVAASPKLKSMRLELQLMSHLDVMLSMDSANMHLASLVGTRVVSVWGATHPFAGFLGWQQSEDDCVQLPLPCRPCSVFGKKPCRRGDFACMNGIEEERIVSLLYR